MSSAYGGFRRQSALGLFAFLQILDLLTTIYVLQHGGFEANPLVQSLIPLMGTITALAVCKAGLVLVTWLVARRRWILVAGNSLYAAIVGWNGLMIMLAMRTQAMAGA